MLDLATNGAQACCTASLSYDLPWYVASWVSQYLRVTREFATAVCRHGKLQGLWPRETNRAGCGLALRRTQGKVHISFPTAPLVLFVACWRDAVSKSSCSVLISINSGGCGSLKNPLQPHSTIRLSALNTRQRAHRVKSVNRLALVVHVEYEDGTLPLLLEEKETAAC